MQHYWHAIDAKKEYFQSRQCGGGGIMVWAAFSRQGTLFLKFVDSTMSAKDYVLLMKKTIVNKIGLDIDQFIFQQDIASVHKAQIEIIYGDL